MRDPRVAVFTVLNLIVAKLKTNLKRGYTIQVLREGTPIETASTLQKLKKLSFGKNFHSDFFKYYGKTIPVTIICEDLLKKENFIELDKKLKDKDGFTWSKK